MKRFAANCLYCSPTDILFNAGVELNDLGGIVRVFKLGPEQPEIHSTVFLDGIIVGFALSQQLPMLPVNIPVFDLLKEWTSKGLLISLEAGKQCNLYLIEEIDWSSRNTTADSAFRLLSSSKL